MMVNSVHFSAELQLTQPYGILNRMVELRLDDVFGALSNKHRRDILRRCAFEEQSASRLCNLYGITLAAVAKHITVLERAGLIVTRKRGKERLASLDAGAVKEAQMYLKDLEAFWASQLDSLEAHLERHP